MQFLTQGSLLIFARTNGIVDRTRGYFVRNLSCDSPVTDSPAGITHCSLNCGFEV